LKVRSLLDLPDPLDLVEDGRARRVLNLANLDLKSSRDGTMVADGRFVSFVWRGEGKRFQRDERVEWDRKRETNSGEARYCPESGIGREYGRT